MFGNEPVISSLRSIYMESSHVDSLVLPNAYTLVASNLVRPHMNDYKYLVDKQQEYKLKYNDNVNASGRDEMKIVRR